MPKYVRAEKSRSHFVLPCDDGSVFKNETIQTHGLGVLPMNVTDSVSHEIVFFCNPTLQDSHRTDMQRSDCL